MVRIKSNWDIMGFDLGNSARSRPASDSLRIIPNLVF